MNQACQLLKDEMLELGVYNDEPRSHDNSQLLAKHQLRTTVFLVAVIGLTLMCFEKLGQEALLFVSMAASYYFVAHM